jgi:hypothetical protein
VILNQLFASDASTLFPEQRGALWSQFPVPVDGFACNHDPTSNARSKGSSSGITCKPKQFPRLAYLSSFHHLFGGGVDCALVMCAALSLAQDSFHSPLSGEDVVKKIGSIVSFCHLSSPNGKAKRHLDGGRRYPCCSRTRAPRDENIRQGVHGRAEYHNLNPTMMMCVLSG